MKQLHFVIVHILVQKREVNNMENVKVRATVFGYMSTVLIHGAHRFSQTKKYNFLDNIGNIDKHTNDIIFSTTLDHFTICTSIESIQFLFDNEALIDAVFALNKREQNIIFHKFLLDMTDIQIASLYGVSRQVITRDRLHALKKLRMLLEEHMTKMEN